VRLSAAANSDIINVRLLEYATPPVRPRFPRILFVLLSIPLGFALSISVALLREYMDHRVSDPDTAEAVLGVPCYGSVPRFRFWNLRRLG
jgi:capsular polysaccharide biosynthesis protein